MARGLRSHRHQYYDHDIKRYYDKEKDAWLKN